MEKMVVSIPKDAEYFFRRAINAESREKPQSVLKYYDQAIAIAPDYAMAWNEKANFLDSIGSLDEALVCYDTAIRIDPEDAEAWFNKGLTLKKMGRDSDAIPCINRGIELAIG
jgi:tetratricopeptide (TPR) repeat protein